MRALVLAAALVACQGTGREPAPEALGSGSGSGHATGFGSRDAAPAVAPADAQDEGSAAKPDEPEPVDVGKAIADLGGISAWEAVVERARYLERRGQHGVVFGTLGDVIQIAAGGDAGLATTPYHWLVDDTEGNGSLAIRVDLGPQAGKAKPGDRVALGGAWTLDDQHAWFWKVDAMSPLPAAPPPSGKDAASQLGHAIANGDMPRGAKPISRASDGDLVYFQLVGMPPVLDGDGWPVADELGNPVAALLDLPGETASYGGQDLRTPDERWHLKRGVTYALRVGVVHHHGADKPATMRARTAPIKVM
jgi:hypothetical protein